MGFLSSDAGTYAAWGIAFLILLIYIASFLTVSGITNYKKIQQQLDDIDIETSSTIAEVNRKLDKISEYLLRNNPSPQPELKEPLNAANATVVPASVLSVEPEITDEPKVEQEISQPEEVIPPPIIPQFNSFIDKYNYNYRNGNNLDPREFVAVDVKNPSGAVTMKIAEDKPLFYACKTGHNKCELYPSTDIIHNYMRAQYVDWFEIDLTGNSALNVELPAIVEYDADKGYNCLVQKGRVTIF